MRGRDDFKIHWFYTHWHWPTLQNGTTYPTLSVSAKMRNHTEHLFLLFKQ
jgi:hypothetical protein